MQVFFNIAGVICWVIIWRKWKTHRRRFRIATNCLMAWHVLMNDEADLCVAAGFRGSTILHGMGYGDPDTALRKLKTPEFYAVMALALMEMDIPPPFKGETWTVSRNPVLDAALMGPTTLAGAQEYLTKVHGVTIDLPEEPRPSPADNNGSRGKTLEPDCPGASIVRG